MGVGLSKPQLNGVPKDFKPSGPAFRDTWDSSRLRLKDGTAAEPDWMRDAGIELHWMANADGILRRGEKSYNVLFPPAPKFQRKGMVRKRKGQRHADGKLHLIDCDCMQDDEKKPKPSKRSQGWRRHPDPPPDVTAHDFALDQDPDPPKNRRIPRNNRQPVPQPQRDRVYPDRPPHPERIDRDPPPDREPSLYEDSPNDDHSDTATVSTSNLTAKAMDQVRQEEERRNRRNGSVAGGPDTPRGPAGPHPGSSLRGSVRGSNDNYHPNESRRRSHRYSEHASRYHYYEGLDNIDENGLWRDPGLSRRGAGGSRSTDEQLEQLSLAEDHGDRRRRRSHHSHHHYDDVHSRTSTSTGRRR